MSDERWRELMREFMTTDVELTPDEISAGWHFCWEFDGLLVGPGMEELKHCQCRSCTPESDN